jgi:peptidoglycan/LPS O-acetylase OafA/YrhL
MPPHTDQTNYNMPSITSAACYPEDRSEHTTLVNKSGLRYIPQIDAMRAVAVLSVLIYHLHPGWLPGGFSGVDVFFVISGYVVSRSMAEQRASGVLHFALQFYAKRVRRIVPALVVCLLVTSFISTLFVPEAWLSDVNNRTGLFAFFGVSNLLLMTSGNDYFAPRTEFNPFTHTWSLGVEEQFYFFFPMLFYVWIILRDRHGFRAHLGTLALLFLVLLSMLICFVATSRAPTMAFYSLPSRFWELGAGALLFQLHSRNHLLVRASRTQVLVLITSLCFLAVAFAFTRMQGFPMPWALCAVFGTLGIISAVAQGNAQSTVVGRALANPAIVFIGTISYSLYLWHWPVYVLFRWTIGLQGWTHELMAIGLTTVLSIISYYGIENVVRRSTGLRRSSSHAVVLGGLATLAVSAAVAYGVFQSQPQLSLSVTRNREIWYPNYQAPRQGSVLKRCQATHSTKQMESTKVMLFPSSECISPHTNHNLFVVGDSHATAYQTLLDKLSSEQHVNVYLYHSPGCSFISLLSPISKTPENCQKFARDSVRDIQERAKPGDVVFLPSLRLKRLADQWSTFAEHEVFAAAADARTSQDRGDALLEARTVVLPFVAASLHVIFEAPTPIFRSPPFRCSDWFNSSNPICAPGFAISRAFFQDYRKPVMESLAQLASTSPLVSIWDPLDALCPETTCYAIDRGTPLFFDADHLSAHGNRVLYSPFLMVLKRERLFD